MYALSYNPLASALGPGRFLREIEITADPRILPLLDSGEAEGHLFHAMPYWTGKGSAIVSTGNAISPWTRAPP